MAHVFVGLFYVDSKLTKIFSGILSIAVLGSGFMLLPRVGIPHSGPYPFWILYKLAMWLVLAIATPIVIKRYKRTAKRLMWPYIILLISICYMVIFKPI